MKSLFAEGLLLEPGKAASPPCPFCGQPEEVELFEVYADGSFQISTCCEGMHESVTDFLNEDPRQAAAWVAGELGAKELCQRSLRRVVDDGGGQLLLDWNLELVPIAWAGAKAFILEHHRHCRPPAGWRFGKAVRNGFQIIGVVTVGRTVARGYDKTKVVEVNRLCIRTDISQPLAWNACSLLYGWSAREAAKRGFSRIITYTLEHELGTTLKAAGWTMESVVKGRSWNTPSRPREDAGPTVNKVRWVRELRPARRPDRHVASGNAARTEHPSRTQGVFNGRY